MSQDTRPPGAGGAGEGFDAARIPPWPRVTVHLPTDPADPPVIDGRTVAAEAGAGAEVIRRVVAAHVRARGLRGIHVVGTAGDDRATHHFVIDAAGGYHELAGDAGKKATAGPPLLGVLSRRAAVYTVGAVVALVVLLAGGGLVIEHVGRPAARPVSTASTAPVGTPTPFPDLPPAGWSTQAAWSVPVDPDSPVAVTAAGQVATTSPGGSTLRVLDPSTGGIAWSLALPARPVDGLHTVHVDGREAVAFATGTDLDWADTARNPDGSHATGQVGLPAQAAVSWAGPSPLISTPGQHAYVIAAGRLAERVVPAGATAVAAAGSTVYAADHAGKWWALTGLNPTEAHTILRESGTATASAASTGGPAPVYAAGHIIAAEPGDGAGPVTIAVVDVATGRVSSTKVSPEALAGGQWLPNAAGTFGALGDVAINLPAGSVRPLGQFTPTAAVADRLYGTANGLPAVYAAGGTVIGEPAGTATPAAISGGVLLTVSTNTPDGSAVLYALTPTPGSHPSATATPSPAPSSSPSLPRSSPPLPRSPAPRSSAAFRPSPSGRSTSAAHASSSGRVPTRPAPTTSHPAAPPTKPH